MEELDFTRPDSGPANAAPAAAPPPAPRTAQSPYYKPDVAQAIFRAAGRAERFAAGTAIFEEDEKAAGGFFSRKSAARMYFLAAGEVSLTIGGKPLDTLKAGEVFGEMAVISGQPRTAAARAKTDCAAYSIGVDELQAALAQAPEFALMLMSVMFDRLRFLAARLAMRRGARASGPGREAAGYPPELVDRVEATLARSAVVRHLPGATLMREGQGGSCLYLVKEGVVAISIAGNVVERVQAGASFGEMAVVDQSPRTASATAETECVLLAIDRASLVEAVRRVPDFGLAMLRDAAERLRHMNAQLS